MSLSLGMKTSVSSFENQVTVKRNGTAVITSLRTPEISNSRYRLVVSILLALSIFTESLKSDAPTPYKRTHEYTTCNFSFKVQKKVYRKQRCPSKPDQQVGESASICTHVSSDELPDAAQIHAAPGVLSSLSPLIVKNGHIRR